MTAIYAALFSVGVAELDMYLIPVRNEHTGEVRFVEVLSTHYCDAQIEALHRLFRTEGWRKATALMPEQLMKTA